MLEVHICLYQVCPGSSQDKISFCSSQERTWPGPGDYSIPAHVIFWGQGPFWLGKCGMKREVG